MSWHNRWWGTRQLAPYAFAVVILAAASVIRIALNPVLGDRQAFVTYFAAVIIVAAASGAGPSLFTLFGGLPLALWLFLPWDDSLLQQDAYNYFAIAAYLGLGAPIVALGALFRRARQQAEHSDKLVGVQAILLDAERKRLNDDLGRLTQELRDMDRRREDFLALLAKELRRPLVPIASAASFHSIAATASEMESAMDVVKQETAKLSRLIDDLLDGFRSTTGLIEINKQPLNLVEVASRAADGVRSMAAQSGRELSITMSKQAVIVDGDPIRLERVVYNLLIAAIRSTIPGGQIWMSVQTQERFAVLKVRDSGRGPAELSAPHLFQSRGGTDDRSWPERGDISVSLSVIKPIIDVHGGTIVAQGDGAGPGGELVIRLPLAAAMLPADQPPGSVSRTTR